MIDYKFSFDIHEKNPGVNIINFFEKFYKNKEK